MNAGAGARRRSSGLTVVELREIGTAVREVASDRASTAAVLHALEAGLGHAGCEARLPQVALSDVRVLLAASSLRRRGLQAALIADALCAGELPTDVFTPYLDGEHGSGWVVERLLGLGRVEASYWRQWTIPWPVARDTLDHDHWRCALASSGGCSGGLEIDHFLPLALGGFGATDHDNFWTLCRHHNGPQGKWADFPDERLERVFAATDRSLPSAYVEMLSAPRPWAAPAAALSER